MASTDWPAGAEGLGPEPAQTHWGRVLGTDGVAEWESARGLQVAMGTLSLGNVEVGPWVEVKRGSGWLQKELRCWRTTIRSLVRRCSELARYWISSKGRNWWSGFMSATMGREEERE